MSTIQNIITAIENTEHDKLQKNVMVGFVRRAEEKVFNSAQDSLLIKEIANETYITEILVSTDEVKIYTISGKDECSKKYPYRSIFKNDEGKWKRIGMVSPTLDTAMIVYLEHKHLGENSRFSDFAIKMLGIELED